MLVRLLLPFTTAISLIAQIAAPAFSPSSVVSARIAVLGKAYIGLPIWMAVSLPEPHQRTVRYPVTIYPWDLGGHSFELRRNGVAVPKLQHAGSIGGVSSGPVSAGIVGGGSLLGLQREPRIVGRLPLHLLFHFQEPGRYEVRYTGSDFGLPGRPGTALFRSQWLAFEVHRSSEAQQSAAFKALLRVAPDHPSDLLSDHLPALLAWRDPSALAVWENYQYHPDQLVRNFSMYALYLFPDATVVRWIRDTLGRRGPTPELSYLVSWRKNLLQPHAAELATHAIRHLRSQSPLVTTGAIQTLGFLKLGYDWSKDRKTLASMDAAVLQRADSIIESSSPEILQSLAVYLGGVKTDRSRELLWRLVEQGTARRQALIALKWIDDPRDGPRLSAPR